MSEMEISTQINLLCVDAGVIMAINEQFYILFAIKN